MSSHLVTEDQNADSDTLMAGCHSKQTTEQSF